MEKSKLAQSLKIERIEWSKYRLAATVSGKLCGHESAGFDNTPVISSHDDQEKRSEAA